MRKKNADRLRHRRNLRKRKALGLCHRCGRVPHENGFAYCSNCRSEIKNLRDKLRLEVFENYGGCKCQCCGEGRIEFLSLDHIKGRGAGAAQKKKLSMHSLYSFLRKRGFPPGYRVLCMNCNFSIGMYGYCPHEERRNYVLTRSGQKVSPLHGVPTLSDVAIQLGKICRYAGASKEFWPVLLHSFVVCDLLPDTLKIYGLAHDAIEVITSDCPSPYKTSEFEEIEKKILNRFILSLGLPSLSSQDWAQVKKADIAALSGEVWTIGSIGLQKFFTKRNTQAEKIVLQYFKKYPAKECISETGTAPKEFVARFEKLFSVMLKKGLAWKQAE